MSPSSSWITTDQACSAEKHGMHAGDKTGVPSGTTLSREDPEGESSSSCC